MTKGFPGSNSEFCKVSIHHRGKSQEHRSCLKEPPHGICLLLLWKNSSLTPIIFLDTSSYPSSLPFTWSLNFALYFHPWPPMASFPVQFSQTSWFITLTSPTSPLPFSCFLSLLYITGISWWTPWLFCFSWAVDYFCSKRGGLALLGIWPLFFQWSPS